MSHFNPHEVHAVAAGALRTYTDDDGALVIVIEALPRRADGEIDLPALGRLLDPIVSAL